MKSFTCFLAFFLGITVSAFAQTEKGSFLVGGTANLGIEPQNDGDNQFFSGSLSPQGGFFLLDNFVVGASVPLSFYRADGARSRSIGVGPFVRYYFGQSKVRLFLEGELRFQRSKTFIDEPSGSGEIEIDDNYTTYGGGVGLAYFITPIVGLEGILSYAANSQESTFPSGAGLQFNVGFQIYLSRSNNE